MRPSKLIHAIGSLLLIFLSSEIIWTLVGTHSFRAINVRVFALLILTMIFRDSLRNSIIFILAILWYPIILTVISLKL